MVITFCWRTRSQLSKAPLHETQSSISSLFSQELPIHCYSTCNLHRYVLFIASAAISSATPPKYSLQQFGFVFSCSVHLICCIYNASLFQHSKLLQLRLQQKTTLYSEMTSDFQITPMMQCCVYCHTGRSRPPAQTPTSAILSVK